MAAPKDIQIGCIYTVVKSQNTVCLFSPTTWTDSHHKHTHTLVAFNTSENEMYASKNTHPFRKSHLKHLASFGNNVKSYVRKEHTKTYHPVPRI
jgi:hypothetical protein